MWSNPAHLAYIVLSPLLSTIFAFINGITIYVFYMKFRLATLSLVIIVNICVCDIFVCILSNTFYVANILHPQYAWTTGAVSCKLFKFLTMLTNVAQIYFLCFLNADRLRRLIDATNHQWRKRTGYLFAALGWLFAFALCLPRLLLFDEKVITKFSPEANATVIVNFNCKPVGLDKTSFTAITWVTFVLAFAIPACFIIYSLIRSQIFMWQRRKKIHMSTTKNAVIKMNSKLSLTFNLTATLFMVVWTPFFVLSLIDLKYEGMTTESYINTNFSLRCTLLILGSAKPLVYLICLDKFRKSFKCGTSDEKTARIENSGSDERFRTDTHQGTTDTRVACVSTSHA